MISDADFEGFVGYGVYVGQVPLIELERCFFLDDVDLGLIGKRRGDHNRLGFAVQLGTVRYLGLFLSDPTAVPAGAVDYIAKQIGVADPSCLKHYLDRRPTRFAHAAEIADQYRYRDFNVVETDLAVWIGDRAWTTSDGPKALFHGAVVWLRDRRVLLPGRSRLARLVAQERERSTQRLFDVLSGMVTPTQAVRLDALLDVPDGARVSVLERLRTGPTSQSVAALIAALDRVVEIETLGFAAVDDAVVPVRRLVELARWGMAGKAQSLRRHPENRRIATLLATARHLEGRSIDDAIEVFDVLMTNDLMAKARREAKTETLRRYPFVARDAAICASVIEVLLRPDGPDTLSELWVTINRIVSRPMPAAAAANIIAVTPPPDADPGGEWREAIIDRYQTARRFLPKLCATIRFSATTEAHGILTAFVALPGLITARPTRRAPSGYLESALIDPAVVPAGWWHQLVYTRDRPAGTVDRAGYVFCVLEQFHQRLRHREIFATNSTRWTDPRARLLAGVVWEQARPAILNSLGLPRTTRPVPHRSCRHTARRLVPRRRNGRSRHHR